MQHYGNRLCDTFHSKILKKSEESGESDFFPFFAPVIDSTENVYVTIVYYFISNIIHMLNSSVKSVIIESTAVGQAVACAPVTQRARVRSLFGTSFLGEVFSGFSSPVRQISGSFRPPRSPNIIWPSLSSIIISLRAPIT